MKKFVCLLLLLWLPLFSASAAAMSTQMQLMNIPADQPAMPCHDAAANNITANSGTQQPCCNEHESSHSCFACGVCAYSHAPVKLTADIDLRLPALISSTPRYVARVFSSALYPPALKPPISA